MTTIRVASRRRFTQVERETVNDRNLSFRARGVLFWLLDKPDDWKIESSAIARHGTEGRDAIRAALTELEGAGYLTRTKVQVGHGQWSTVVTVFESSQNALVAPTTENQSSENQSSENQSSVFQASITNTDTKTDNSQTYPQGVNKSALASYRMPEPRAFCEECEGWTDGEGPTGFVCQGHDDPPPLSVVGP